MEAEDKQIIPLKIYQTWATKDLPPKMSLIVEKLKRDNPEFEHHLFDDNDCREFIKHHFHEEVLSAYDKLIPGAYKADLWRCCVLYINGGIYLDIKLQCINGFKLIELTKKSHLVKDRVRLLSIYNALMVCKKESPFLWKAIYRIVINAHTKFYGNDPLEPTGPIMLGNLILKNKFPVNIDLIHHPKGGYILYKNKCVISTEYSEYNNERNNYYSKKHTKRYDVLWEERKVYSL